MKKLMIALAAMGVALGVQAAAVTWTITNVYKGNDSDKASGIAYVFLNTTALDTSSWTDATSAMAWINANALGKNGTAFSWQGSDGNFGMNTATDPALLGLTADGTTKYQLYAVIFDTTSVTDASNYYVTDAMSKGKAIANSSTTTQFSIGDQLSKSQAPGNWSSVAAPEPTSGLLLLLGMAGLALKRKRA